MATRFCATLILVLIGLLQQLLVVKSDATKLSYSMEDYCGPRVSRPPIIALTDDFTNTSSITLSLSLQPVAANHSAADHPHTSLRCAVTIRTSSAEAGIVAIVSDLRLHGNDSTLEVEFPQTRDKKDNRFALEKGDEIIANATGTSSGAYVTIIFIHQDNHESTTEEGAEEHGPTEFTIVFTAFKSIEAANSCNDTETQYNCGNDRCIWSGLVCDHINNCGSGVGVGNEGHEHHNKPGADEESCPYMKGYFLGISHDTWILIAFAGILAILVSIFVIIAIYVRARRTRADARRAADNKGDYVVLGPNNAQVQEMKTTQHI